MPGRPRSRSGGRGSPDRRLRLALALLVTVVLVLAGRLVQVQGLDGPHWSRLAQDQRLHTVTLAALRGQITDRSGVPLAESVDARDIDGDPLVYRTGGPGVDLNRTAAALAPLLHVPAATLTAKLSGTGQFVYLARDVSPALGAAVARLNLPGVAVEPASRREYPDGPLAAGVLGFVGADGQGLAGLEYLDNAFLTGRDGSHTYEIGRDGRQIPTGENIDVPARPGGTLQLTLDSDIQWQAQQALARQVQATGALSGTAIVMDPRNGQVLALATAPGFDPNHPGAASASLLGDPAVSDVYEPGSVNKVITMSAALAEGLANPSTPVTVPPTLPVAGTVFHDAEAHGTEHLTLTGVLALSSNIGTIEIAQKLGPATLYRYLQAYGFGRPTGIGLPGESGGILPPPDQWSGTTLPTIAFGQGVAVTAMQVATVYATIANGGVRVAPTIVKARIGPDGSTLPDPTPERHRVISARVAHELSDMLEAVTTDQGTAPAAQITGYRVAGKTGTASRPDGHGGYSGYTASFVGFAPADHPQLLVEVVLQKPQKGYYGGTVAAPVFHDIMSFALQALHIPPTGTKPPVARITVP